MSLYQLDVSPKALGLDVFGMTIEPGRAMYEYVDGARTDNPRVNDAGKPLFRHPALLRVAGQRPFESSIVLDQEEGLGEFAQVVMTADSLVTIRGARSEYGGLEFSVSGSIAKSEKKDTRV